ncbi:MAG: PASTA domain-containing protein [Solirubrobacteraceae bacterium]|nr:PASTA domain-containing protein [Solirubrobacteraceae bacterium]
MTLLATIRLSALAALAALAASAPQALAAPATCVSATPAIVNLADDPADAEPGAPELTGVRATVNADCTVSVRMTLGNRDVLRPDDALLVYLDTDGNPTTGAKSFAGADRGVGLVADEDGPGYLALLGRWDTAADAIDFENATELDISAAGSYGFTAGIDDLGVKAGSTLGISIAALSEPDGEIALDFAPDDEGGVFRLPLAFTTTADAPGSTPGTTGTTPSPREQAIRRTCRVPKLRGRTPAAARKALKAAGCRVGRTRGRHGTDVRKGRVAGTLPAAGKRIAASRPVTVLVSRG